MKFQLAINLERMDTQTSMQEVAKHTLEMVQMADAEGFEIVWAAEHHAIEMTIAPNPFQILTWWSQHTNNIRLGLGVVNACYWHPIRLAGEAAMLDLISGGRLDFGIGSGAYQREFDRMKPGVSKNDGWQYMQEILPVVKQLWQGDVEHNGRFWQFPSSTSCPKPVQKEVPIWVAARSPITFDYAVKNKCNIMSWPLSQPFSEAQRYKQFLNESLVKHSHHYQPNFAMMRHTSVYDNAAAERQSLNSLIYVLGQFENLMQQKGEVINGFPEQVELNSLTQKEQYAEEMLLQNMMFGKPDTIIKKLQQYQQLGVDSFIYYASFGLEKKTQRQSLRLFIDEVMPAFQ